jgi:hypothetical protein
MRELIIFIVLLVPVLAVYLWWKLFNTPNGERYLKMRMQGPFVPAGDDAQKDIDRNSGAPKI